MIKKIKNFELLMEVDTEYEQHRFDTFFIKEPETISWIKEIFNKNDIFFDIGANIGIYSLFASAYFKDNLRVYAFEPAYHNFSKMCQNILINKFINIKPYCLAFGDKTEFNNICLVSEISGSANHYLKFENDVECKFEQGIFCISLDDLIYKFNFPKPNHIKIDVDGLEDIIIKGANRLLYDPELRSILIEVTDEDNKKEIIMQKMIKCGFNINSINFQENHSKKRRSMFKNNKIENIIFTK